jgi:hypothetical protein
MFWTSSLQDASASHTYNVLLLHSFLPVAACFTTTVERAVATRTHEKLELVFREFQCIVEIFTPRIPHVLFFVLQMFVRDGDQDQLIDAISD